MYFLNRYDRVNSWITTDTCQIKNNSSCECSLKEASVWSGMCLAWRRWCRTAAGSVRFPTYRSIEYPALVASSNTNMTVHVGICRYMEVFWFALATSWFTEFADLWLYFKTSSAISSIASCWLLMVCYWSSLNLKEIAKKISKNKSNWKHSRAALAERQPAAAKRTAFKSVLLIP